MYIENKNSKLARGRKMFLILKRLFFISFLLCSICFTRVIAQIKDNHYSFLRIDNTDGLVNNQTTTIYKDSRGFIWFGTSSGLSRFDGVGFKNYTHDEYDSTSISDNFISNIQEDKNGDLWIEMQWDYIVYDFDKEVFVDINTVLQHLGLTNTPVLQDVYIDIDKKIWFRFENQNRFSLYNPVTKKLVDPFQKEGETPYTLIDFYHDGLYYYYLYANGMLECYSGRDYSLVYRDDQLINQLGSDSLSAKLFVDASKHLWLYGNNDGIYHFDADTKKWRHFTTHASEIQLTSNLIKDIVQDTKGNIWIGTDHGGIDIYNPQTNRIQSLYYQPENPKSISQNSITNMLVDDEGIVWIGTYKNGICYYHESIHKFPHFRHLTSDPSSLPYNDVNCFAEDKTGNIWIGTNGGGLLYYNRKQDSYKTYKHIPNDPNSLSNNVVVNLFIDDEGLLWIGTFTGGLNVFDGKKFYSYKGGRNRNSDLPNNSIWTITQDDQRRVWIGTLGGGIILYNKEKKTFEDVVNQGPISLPSDFISSIHKMRSGNMLIGTALGIVFYDIEGKRYRNHPIKEGYEVFDISNYNVNDVYEDSRGLIWVATREGLTMIDPFINYVDRFEHNDDLNSAIINCIEEDENHNIWVSKSSGLSEISVEVPKSDQAYSFDIHDFTVADGLQAKEFNVNASGKTSKGELLFGGPNGFNLFQPENIEYNQTLPKVYFTDFQIFNKSIEVGETVKNKVILTESIVSTDQIELKHSMNVFSIEFAALNYLMSEQVECKYMLEGFDQDWINADDNIRKVTYTNLNAGAYTFKVMASNNDGLWTEDYATLHINILPPFYKTPLAYVFYVLFIIAVLLYFRYAMLKKERVKFQMEQERIQARRHQEMDEMKLRFLTNVSHEFRTPLTLILTPLEKLMKSISDKNDQKLLETIERNTKQLLGLVNQLLDFRQLDLHGLRFNPSYGDIVAFLKDVCDIFADSFQKKSIQFHFSSTLDTFFFQFDHEKIQKVLMNLLSNSLKFTPNHGKVSVNIEFVANEIDNYDEIIIKVTDTGIGISEEDKEKIFDRFYQSEGHQHMGLTGSGIGLNLAREMVQLHSGSIDVKSTLGKGSVFMVHLPIEEQEETIPDKVEEVEEITAPLEIQEGQNGQQAVLLVEDNQEFRTFMKETLSEHYKVYEAIDGQDGISKVHEAHPDLIISDVMMPKLDGLEMCKKLKGDLRTSHIPLILLTARTADQDKIKGLEIGADDYITKPFKMDLLMLRVQNMMDKQKRTQKRFQKKVDINPSEIEISTIDEKLIKKAITLVEKNISEPKFSVEDLSHELGMSRVYLYKKLMAITGKSPIEFIRIIRLKRGAQLLEKSQMTISEVAYEVGFNSPRYFSKYFEEEYGVLPSVYIKKFGDKK